MATNGNGKKKGEREKKSNLGEGRNYTGNLRDCG